MMTIGMSFDANHSGLMPADWIRDKATTFRHSPWIDSLNEVLRYELAAVDIYRIMFASAQFDATTIADEHAMATRKLAVLVIAHRGVPADRPAQVTAGLNKAILQICSLMPGEINQRFIRTRLAGLEKQLCLMYASLAARAPASDRETLDQLGTLAADHHLALRRGFTAS
jgi:hypothetical protein